MKAAVLNAPKELRIEAREVPCPGRGELLIRVKSAALCGTDIRMWANGIAGNPPRVLGHEIAGEVAALGDAVQVYAVGDKVAVAPNMGCGLCDCCASGNGHMCPDYRALGINLDGGFAEYVLVPEGAVRSGNVCKLGPNIGYAEAAAVEALSCVYNGFEHYGARPGDAALIIGAGPIGVMHAILCRMAGAAKVIMNDLSGERLSACAASLPGIETYCGDDLAGYINDATAGRGLDVCVTACPSPQAQAQSLALMGLGGRVCFFGGLPAGKNMVPLDTNIIHYRQLLVTGTTRASLAQYRKCLQLVESGVIDLSPVITNRFALDEIGQAFEFASKAGGLKSVIDF